MSESTAVGASGFQEFRLVIQALPLLAATQVRSWILKESVHEAALTLLCLPQMLESEELSALFSHLSLAERKLWKNILDQRKEGPSGEEYNIADAFVLSEIRILSKNQEEAFKRAA